MNNVNLMEIFLELRKLADEDLDDRLPEKIHDLKDRGIELRVETSLEDPEFIEDPSHYTEVVQYCDVWIGQLKVYDWEETYWGSFGAMGAGWWIELGHTSLDGDVQTLLELLELLPEFPNVPQPESPESAGDDE